MDRKKAVRDAYGRFEHGLPGTGDAQLFSIRSSSSIQRRIWLSPLVLLPENSGEPLEIIAARPLSSSLLIACCMNNIIALPSQLFYNTDIGIYAFILSKNKRPDRKGKVQLINAVNMWKPLRKSLGKKRREIDRDSMTRITDLYANFEETPESKIFSNEEFMYREYSVWQPLQRRGVLDQESIDRLRTSAYFASNSSIFNEADFAELGKL